MEMLMDIASIGKFLLGMPLDITLVTSKIFMHMVDRQIYSLSGFKIVAYINKNDFFAAFTPIMQGLSLLSS